MENQIVCSATPAVNSRSGPEEMPRIVRVFPCDWWVDPGFRQALSFQVTRTIVFYLTNAVPHGDGKCKNDVN
jgi:hypothetical protein